MKISDVRVGETFYVVSTYSRGKSINSGPHTVTRILKRYLELSDGSTWCDGFGNLTRYPRSRGRYMTGSAVTTILRDDHPALSPILAEYRLGEAKLKIRELVAGCQDLDKLNAVLSTLENP